MSHSIVIHRNRLTLSPGGRRLGTVSVCRLPESVRWPTESALPRVGRYEPDMNCFKPADTSHRCRIVLLDQTELVEDIRDATLGQELLDRVCRHLKLREAEYFGLRFVHTTKQPHWLKLDKKAAKQLKGTDPYTVYFCVKYYVTDPCKLQDEITRYQVFLQVKKDIEDGRLPITSELAPELAAYVTQSEMGDYDSALHTDSYCHSFPSCGEPAAGAASAADVHKTLLGMTPAAAESALLQRVRWLEMYGADLHPVLGEQHAESFIGLAPAGVVVLRGKGKANTYFWTRIIKVYCKKNSVMLRVRDKENVEQTFAFETSSRLACQQLVQSCNDHRQFFHRAMAQPPAVGSSSHSSDRTEGQGGPGSANRQRQTGRRGPGPAGRAASPPDSNGVGAPDPSPACHKTVSVPQPIQSASEVYRANSVSMQTNTPPDSPRSVHSTALSANQLQGLFNTNTIHKTRSRVSINSQSSTDSRTLRRHRHRRESSGGSDASSGQGSTRSSRRHRGRRVESGSDSDRSAGGRRHRGRRRREQQASCELVDSERQWLEVQRLQAERLRPSGYQNSGMETESELSYQPKRRVKKHSRSRSRSRSPDTARSRRLPAELWRHLQFGLVEPTPDGAGDIPYTKVTTEVRMPRIRYATKRSQKGESVGGKKPDACPDNPAAGAPQGGAAPDGAIPPADCYPRPLPALPSTPRAGPGNTLSSYYVTGGGSGRGRQSSPSSQLVTSPVGRQMAAPASERTSTVAVDCGTSTPQPGHASRTSEPPCDNSDSGLGNESPIEFARQRAQRW